MNRSKFIRMVADVVELIDERLEVEQEVEQIIEESGNLDELRDLLQAADGETLLDAAKRFYASAQIAYEEQKRYKSHASILSQILGTNPGGDVVEAVRALVEERESDGADHVRRTLGLGPDSIEGTGDAATRITNRLAELHNQAEWLRSIFGAKDGETTQAAAERVKATAGGADEPEIRRLLAARATETTLEAAERAVEHARKLVYEQDQYDVELSKLLDVGPGSAIKAVKKLLEYVSQLELRYTAMETKVKELEEES